AGIVKRLSRGRGARLRGGAAYLERESSLSRKHREQELLLRLQVRQVLVHGGISRCAAVSRLSRTGSGAQGQPGRTGEAQKNSPLHSSPPDEPDEKCHSS